MTSYSKYFNIATENATCADFVHCGNTCWEMFHWNAFHMFLGCCKYIGPISVIPVLMKFREFNVDLLNQCCRKFLEYSVASWLMCVAGLSFMCFYFKLFGKFYTWSALGLPAATGAIICVIICSNRLIIMFSRGLSSMVTEAIIKLYADNNIFLRLLRDTPSALTFAFMCANTAIIYALRWIKSDVFWFIQPFKIVKNLAPPENIPSPFIDRIIPAKKHYCQHENSCDVFLKQEIINYIQFGIGIEFIRIIFGNLNEVIREPLQFIAFKLLKKVKYNFIVFLLGNTAIYRISTCLLARLFEKDRTRNHLISAFISGTSFYAYPQIPLFGHAFVTAVELLWTNYNHQSKGNNETSLIMSFLNKVPFSRIWYPIIFGYLCYLRPFYPWATPKILMSILRGVTLNRESDIMKAYCTRLFNSSDPYILYLFGRA